MTFTCSSQPFRFLDLPIELRVRVYEILFFEDVDEPAPIQPWTRRGSESSAVFAVPFYHKTQLEVHTAPRQTHPYLRSKSRAKLGEEQLHESPKRFALAIFRVSRRIQAEAEPVFYGSLSFNLMGGQLGAKIASWEWLSQLPRRYRRLIRRVEHFCYNSRPMSRGCRHGDICYSLFDWSLFMSILAKECLALQSLKLWVNSDQQEYEWLAFASEEDAWVKTILQLEHLQNLQEFGMPGIQPIPAPESEHLQAQWWPLLGSRIDANSTDQIWLYYRQSPKPIKSSPAENASIVRLLKARLECRTYRTALRNEPQTSTEVVTSFPILKLPQAIRARIYRYILLPSNKQLHPYIGSWYDETTRNAIPLLLTCRKIREEAEEVLYGEAVFATPKTSKMDMVVALQRFFEELAPRLRAKIRYVHTDGYVLGRTVQFFKYLGEETLVRNLTCSLLPSEVRTLNSAILRPTNSTIYCRGQRVGLKDFEDIFKHFQTVSLHTHEPDEVQYLPEVHEWLASLPAKWMPTKERRKSLRPRKSTATISTHNHWG